MLELRDRVLTLPSLEKRMDSLITEIRKAEEEASALLRQYERESRDVERLRKDSFSSFLFSLIGRYEDKLEKEQREEINAKIAYDRALTRVESLIREKEALDIRISALRTEERTYHTELNNRRRELSGNPSGQGGARYTEIMNERNNIISQITEIEEALRAASRAMSTAETVLKSLDGADGWATFDAFTRGGIISHMAKYSHIDKAEENINVLSHNLRELKSELSDVHGLTVSGINEISSGQRAIDFWFDNIFTDLSVRSQIKDNTGQIKRLIKNIGKAQATLKEKLNNKQNELEINKQSEELLLSSI